MTTPLPSHPPASATVGIAGTGALGSALARAALAHGHPTSVWNRTASRTEPLVAMGAQAHRTPADLLASASVVVPVLPTYADVRAFLAAAGDIAGRTIVSLTSGTPTQSAEMADFVGARDAHYVDGAAMGGTRLVGDPSVVYFYSGDRESFDAVRGVLESFGTPLHLGSDPAMASAYDTATLGLWLAFVSAGYQALTLLDSQGIDASKFAWTTRQFLPYALDQFARHADQIRDGVIESADGTVDVHLAALHLLIDTATANGVNTVLIDTLDAILRGASEAGHGDDGLATLATQFTTTVGAR